MSQTPAAPAPLDDQTALYDLADDGVAYLNTANMSAMLKSVAAAGAAAVSLRGRPWRVAPDDWFSGAETLRTLAGGLIGTDGEGIAIVPSVSYGMAVAAANLAIGPGRDVVLLDGEFPSNLNTWDAAARRTGAAAIRVTRPPGEGWTEAVLAAIDARTAVVSVPHCYWTDGALLDLVRIGGAARAAGAALVVDASQSMGALPLDVAAVRPDFLMSAGYKWLHGPYGLSYLYAAPRWREEGVPIEQSWMTRDGAEDFAGLTRPRDAWRPGARRFDMGEFSQMITLPMAVAGLAQLDAWGVDRIQATLSLVTGRIEQAARTGGWDVEPLGRRAGHMMGVRGSPERAAALGAALKAANVVVSLRGNSIRVAPHLNNGTDDVERLCEVLERVPVT